MSKQDYQWRVLAHGSKGTEFSVRSDAVPDAKPGERFEYDELCLGDWFHLEMMDSGVWWMEIAGFHLWVRLTKKGPVVTSNGKPLSEYGLEAER